VVASFFFPVITVLVVVVGNGEVGVASVKVHVQVYSFDPQLDKAIKSATDKLNTNFFISKFIFTMF